MKDVAVILIGLNAKQYVIECIVSLQNASWREVTYDIIYIDNGSSDGSAAAVESQFGDGVRVIANPMNLGFCPAANQGARVANARYCYFINDDTLAVDDAIATTVEYMDEHPDVGTVGSRLVFPDGSEQYSGRKFPNLYSAVFGRRSFLTRFMPNIKPVSDYLCKNDLAKGDPFDVDWVSAAAQLVRTDEFLSLDGYAEDYYYWHEAVFCHRMFQTGKRIVLIPASTIIHYEGKGSGARPIKSQRFHITDFHRGAFRAYCERHDIVTWSPHAIIVGASLATRGALLLIIAHMRELFRLAGSSLKD